MVLTRAVSAVGGQEEPWSTAAGETSVTVGAGVSTAVSVLRTLVDICREKQSCLCICVQLKLYCHIEQYPQKKQLYSHQLCTIHVPCVYNYTTRLNRVCLTSKTWSQLEMNGGGGKVLGCVFTSTCPSIVVQSVARVATAGTTAWSVGTPVLTVSVPRVTLIDICAVKLAKINTWHTLTHTVHTSDEIVLTHSSYTHTHTLRNNCRGLPMQLTLLEERV